MMRIQKATMHDIDKIMALVNEAVVFMNNNGNFQWDNEYPTQEVFENDIRQGNLFILKDLLHIAGFICLNTHQPQEYNALPWKTVPEAMVIHRMVIGNRYRGQGFARKLFEFAESEAKKQAFKSIRSDTNTNNKAMNHLFKSFSYSFTGNIVLRGKPDLFNCYEKALILKNIH